jgi:E3 ubiquitin-protein ligase SIAH1
MQCHFTNLEQSLLSQMECPVCMEYMRPPIMLCENGHNICNICRPKVRDCPTCRQQFLNTRNVALEKVAAEVIYPCM